MISPTDIEEKSAKFGMYLFRGCKKKISINLNETLQLLALLTTEEMMCSIIQGSSTTDPFATEWSFLHSTGGPVYVKC